MFRALCAASALAGCVVHGLSLGVQSHWPHGEPYASVGGEAVLSLARKLGATMHRTCFSAADVAAGSATAAAAAVFVANATRGGAELLVTLYCDPACDEQITATATPRQAYAGCEQYAHAVASSPALRDVAVWELGNELDQRCLVDATGAPCRDPSTPECKTRGDKPSDYDTAKFEIVAAQLKGLRDGLARAGDRRRTAVGTAGALHYGFLDRLRADFVDLDWNVTAWHWYSWMGNIDACALGGGAPVDVLRRVAGFGRPVWITELGHTAGSKPSVGGESAQAAYLRDELARLKALSTQAPYALLDAVFVYELLDESQLAPSGEAYYGLASVAEQGRLRLKPAFDAVRDAFPRQFVRELSGLAATWTLSNAGEAAPGAPTAEVGFSAANGASLTSSRGQIDPPAILVDSAGAAGAMGAMLIQGAQGPGSAENNSRNGRGTSQKAQHRAADGELLKFSL